jgi:non-specific serine/threonine protein kinase
MPWLNQVPWDCFLLDEAQAIKNPMTQQTLALKKIKAHIRFILTGTPVENRLSDLWSLFDFVAPGLLGSSKQFGRHAKGIHESPEAQSKFYAGLRQLLSPYILRRLKTDKKIIADLPDKTEIQTYTSLTKQQAALYQQVVNELQRQLENSAENTMGRRGIVLSSLMKLKQVCNHPTQMLGHGDYTPELSGKFIRLRELCDEIAAKQEKVLIFTQFTEIIPALSTHLNTIFGRPGLALHGKVPIKDRAKMVASFQGEQGPPFFVLSLKAGGTGLTLTNANHVIHFDRWWNPSVENQATDRAFRIGQKRNVLVHKFIAQGTLEEKIDALISSKKVMSEMILGGDDQISLTEMSNEELIKMVSLNSDKALS